MNVFDQPSVFVQSSVMMATTWRADMTMASTEKHSQTTIQGLSRCAPGRDGDRDCVMLLTWCVEQASVQRIYLMSILRALMGWILRCVSGHRLTSAAGSARL